MTIVCWPPVFAVGQDHFNIIFQRLNIQRLYALFIIQVRKRIAFGIVLTKNVNVETVWPPVLVLGTPIRLGCCAVKWAFGNPVCIFHMIHCNGIIFG